LSCLGVAGYSQDPVYRIINNNDGLPSNSVYNVLQDKQGFIWLGHDKGISRYDGKIFKQFKTSTQQGRSLSNLMEGTNGIWCQDFAGNFYMIKGDSLIRESRIKHEGVYATSAIINKNQLLSIVGQNMQTLNLETGEYLTVKADNDFGMAVNYEKTGATFIDDNSIWFFDGKSKKEVSSIKARPNDMFFFRKFGGEYYGVSKNSYPVIFSFSNNSFNPLPLLGPGLFVQDVNIIDDLLWISTSSGAWCFDLNMKPAYNGHCFFAGKSISKIIKDREGNYWFCTLDNGVLFVPDLNSRLYKYENESITALLPSANRQDVFTGTSNNRILAFDDYQKIFLPLFKEPANHEVLSILEDPQTNWLLFASDRIAMLRNKNKYFEVFCAGKDFTIINNELYGLAHSGGISVLSRNGATSPSVPVWLQQEGVSWQNRQYQLIANFVRGRCVAFNPADSFLYGGTVSGLYYFSPSQKGKITFTGKDIYASQIVVTDKKVYVATYTDGLFEITNGTAASPVVSKGKPISKTIYKLFKSDDWLWLLGDGVLQRYDEDKNELIEFTHADGLPRAEMKDIAVLNGSLYVATTDGLAVLNEYSASENAIAPLLVINKLLVNSVERDWTKRLSLSNRENNIEIDFSLLSYKGGDSLRIEYKINDGNWQQLAPGARTLNLLSLSAGTYLLQVKGYNEDGVATDKPAELSFTIAAPFYKQGWFFTSIVLLAMALVYLYFRWRLNNEKKRAELISTKARLEQELHQSMLSSIKSQMNPHFLFNALNTVQSYIYTNDKENASQYLGKFSELTRMILDMSNKERVSLADEIKALQLYLDLEKQRFEDKLHYSFEVDKSVSTETMEIPSMLIQPYIENAIKHGLMHLKNQWKLYISFKKIGNNIQVTVDDNGVGRKASEIINRQKFKKHEPFSTNANQKRLDILNKGLDKAIALQVVDKEDEHGHATGTTVTLTIPLL